MALLAGPTRLFFFSFHQIPLEKLPYFLFVCNSEVSRHADKEPQLNEIPRHEARSKLHPGLVLQ